MPATEPKVPISISDYLQGERHSEVRHEYLGGDVYARAGASTEHNLLAGNLFAALHSHLRGKGCQVFMSDMKVRLKVASDDIFYYPDILIACDSRDTDRYFKQFPKVLVEVLSPETERTDRREKFLSYIQLETLEEYILVAQDKQEITVFRRKQNWQPEVLSGQQQLLRLESIGFEILLPAIFEGVKRSP